MDPLEEHDPHQQRPPGSRVPGASTPLPTSWSTSFVVGGPPPSTEGFSAPPTRLPPPSSVGQSTNEVPPLSTTATAQDPSVGPPKKSGSRKNAWGNRSYAELIAMAISSSPEQRLTLAQIYDWIVQHIPFFRDKGEANSSAGWKVGSNNDA